jgi:hypothetical protein
VLAAFRAAAEREALLRFATARLAWRDSAACDAEFVVSRLSARFTARATRGHFARSKRGFRWN